MKKTISFKITQENLNKLINDFKNFEIEANNQYILHAYKANDVNISVYTSLKVVMNGENIEEIAKPYGYKPKDWLIKETNSGSDEVGTGDFFGPIVVVSSLVTKDQIEELTKLGINDSKKLTDKFIMDIVPSLLHKYPHSVYILDNEKYNEVYSGINANMNTIKAKMHNQVLIDLSKKVPHMGTTVVDQFCSEELYCKHLSDIKTIYNDIKFMTKADSLVPSVALSSMIARYVFLSKIKELETKYKLSLPLGEGEKVFELANSLDKELLRKIAKLNFKTIKK